MIKKKLLATYFLSLILTAGNFLPLQAETGNADRTNNMIDLAENNSPAVNEYDAKNILDQAENNSSTDTQWTTNSTNPINLTSPDAPNTPTVPDNPTAPDNSAAPDSSIPIDTSSPPDTSTTSDTSVTSDTSTIPGTKAKFGFPIKDVCRKTCNFIEQLPRRTGIFTAGVIIATPVSVVRESVEDTNNDMKELVGDKTNPLLLAAAGTMTILPHSLFSGLIEGVSFGITNSFKHCSDAHISQETLGLKKTESE